jgi:regulator of cell morphogenesis and NO signaling
MIITEQTTIAEIASSVPSSVRIFQRHGIDFCCGGKRPIGVVCQEQGLSYNEIVQLIQMSNAQPEPDARDWSQASLTELVAHILTTYHEPLRQELPRLEAMAAKVARVHGENAPYMIRVNAIVAELADELRSHMQKEEIVLFPAVEAIESRAAQPAMPLSAPIAVMEDEHDHAGALLAELRKITSGYVMPEWGCGTFQALYHGLAELEAAMHVHIHLENNLLFPRALKLASEQVPA